MRVDPQTNEVVATIDVGRQPRHVGLGFGSVWVTNFGSRPYSRIDPATNEVIANVRGEYGPEHIGFTGDAVWIANVIDGSVSRIDPATNGWSTTIPTGYNTEGIVVDADGLVYAAVTGATLSRASILRPTSSWRTSPRATSRGAWSSWAMTCGSPTPATERSRSWT